MKILLLHPPLARAADAAVLVALDNGDNSCVPLGLYSLAAVLLAEGRQVQLANHSLRPWEESLREAVAFAPEVVGITCMTHQRFIVEAWSREIRRRLPGCRIILGGVHVSMLHREILERWPWIDFVAVGEAERSLPQLLRQLEQGDEAIAVPGIAGREADGSPHWPGPVEPIADLASLPIPAEHFAYGIIATTRGCPFSCSFCSSATMWGRRVRERPVEQVIQELTLLRRRHKRQRLHFKDETFTFRTERVRRICQGMLNAGLHLSWTCDTRVDCLNEEQLYWLRKAGCHTVSFGIESGSPRLLKAIDKRITLDKVHAATALARRFGMIVRYYLITNLPGETNDDLQATLELVERNRPHYVLISPLTVSPGTRVYEEYCDRWERDAAMWFDPALPEAVPYDPADPWLHFPAMKGLAVYHNATRHAEEDSPLNPFTEDELRQARELAPDSFLAHFSLAHYLKSRQRAEEAIEAYRRALEIWPDDATARLELGVCLDQTGKLEQAVREWTEIEGLDDEKSDRQAMALIYRGLAGNALGEIPQALGLWRRAHELQPENSEPLRLIAEHGAIHGCWSDVEWAAERWGRLAPQLAQPLHLLALCCMVQGANEDARMLFDRALQLDGQNADIYHNYGLLLARNGETRQAAGLLRKCLAVNPQHPSARNLLAQLE